jgi:hypothetical protein
VNEQVQPDAHASQQVERTADHACARAGNNVSQLGSLYKRIHVHWLHDRVNVITPEQHIDVHPPHRSVDVDTTHHAVSIGTGNEGIDIDPPENVVDVNAVDQMVDVDSVEQPVHVDPIEHPIDVNPVDQMVDVDPVEQRFEVHAVEQRLRVEAIHDVVEVDAIDDRPDVDPPDDLVDVHGINDAGRHVARHRTHNPTRTVEHAPDQTAAGATRRGSPFARSLVHCVILLDTGRPEVIFGSEASSCEHPAAAVAKQPLQPEYWLHVRRPRLDLRVQYKGSSRVNSNAYTPRPHSGR